MNGAAFEGRIRKDFGRDAKEEPYRPFNGTTLN